MLLAALAGCGGGGLDLVPVSGTLRLDGRPVEDAAVMFSPVDGRPVASGTTDAQGTFRLTTTNKPGALVGEHRVTVTKQRVTGITEEGVVAPGGMHVEWLIPERYSRADTSGLRVTVSPKEHEHTFDLSSRQ